MEKKFTLETERLILRPLTKDDAEAMFSYRSDKDTNMFQRFDPSSVADVESYLADTAQEFNIEGSWVQLGIFKKLSSSLIGDIGLHFIGPENSQVEVRVTLSKEQQANGYASEAVVELLRHLYEDLGKHRIIGSIDPDNNAAVALLKKLGFIKEAHFRESYILDGEWRDDMIYALLKSDWEAR